MNNLESRPVFRSDDIVKIVKEGKTTLGRVVDSTETEVLIYRSGGDVWYSTTEYEIESIGSCTP